MLSTAIIVFREVLEIALIIGVVMAATAGMGNRIATVFAGLGIGALGSLLIAVFADAISNAVDGVGQEVFNAAIMFTAVAVLSWTVIWMRRHAREMVQDIKKLGREVVSGEKPLYALVVVIALSTFREGAEIVLFTYGMYSAGQIGISDIIAGGLLGAAGGAICGTLLYVGLLKAAQKHLLTITSWMLVVLAAGMAAQGASFLIAAGFLPEIIPQVWDSSWLIAGDSMVGSVLEVLVGYTPRPTGMELLFYVSVVLSVGALLTMGNKKAPATQPV